MTALESMLLERGKNAMKAHRERKLAGEMF
jgi:hypothetical protein